MRRPAAATAASLALLAGALWYLTRLWTGLGAGTDAGVENSTLVLAAIYAGWYLLLFVGFVRLQGWARALLLYVTPLLYGIDVSVQLIEFDPLPPELLASVAVWIGLVVWLAPRRVAEAFD